MDDEVSLFKLRTETMIEFLQRLRPTETAQSIGAWICCTNEQDQDANKAPDYESRDAALERGRAILEKLVEDLCAPMRGRTKHFLREDASKALKQVAIESGETCGKWMLFPTTAEVDDMWATVAEATVDGRLGDAAQVCTCKEDVMTQSPSKSNKLICVYTSDFQNIDKVKQILDSLIELGFTPSSFKLDFFTLLGIDRESKSVYGISPTMYTHKSIRKIAAKAAGTPASQARWRKR